MAEPIAEYELVARRVAGPPFPVRVVVHKPEPSIDASPAWSCAVTVEPLWSGPFVIFGEGSLQALCLGAKHAIQMLDTFVAQGGTLEYVDGGSFESQAFGYQLLAREARHGKAAMADTFDPTAFVQRQLDAYNARDLERFVREYTQDVTVYRMPDPNPVIVGRAALAAHYRDNRFNLPELHATVVNRMVFGNKVIDQERVVGVPGAPLDVAAIYEVSEQGISKVWFVSAK